MTDIFIEGDEEVEDTEDNKPAENLTEELQIPLYENSTS